MFKAKTVAGIWIAFLVLGYIMFKSMESENQDSAPKAVPDSAAAAAPDSSDKAPGLKDRYVDPNGFFAIVPPAGWRTQGYPQDPRGKVVFISPGEEADLRVLAKAVTTPDFESLIHELQRKERELGVEMNIEPIVFPEEPAVRRLATVTMQGTTRRFLMVDLLVNGVSHNLQYGSSPSAFERLRDVAWRSMLSYEPLRKESSPGEPARHEVAKWTRLARIAIEMGNMQAAKDAIEVGLQTDPNDTELLELKAKLQDK
jgi:hypothetical protein